ncbi:tetratricopeptide repeat-containing sensor histidine kinase [Chryseobacterium sp. A301]
MLKFILIIIICTFCSCKQDDPVSIKSVNSKNHDKANLFRGDKISDSAFYYYSIAKDEYLIDRDSTKAAQALINMAIIQCDNGDYYGSIETSLEADTLLIKKNDEVSKSFLASNYNNLAIASAKLTNYKNAENFYQLALENVRDPENKYVYYNNIGDVLITKGDYKNAVLKLQIALKVKDSIHYARALNNWAYAKYSSDKSFNPTPYYLEALEIRLKNSLPIDLNSSYINLSDYYVNKDPVLSLQFAKQMKKAAMEAGSTPDVLDALKRIIILDKNNYLENFQTYNALSDQILLERSTAKNQFALIRYGVEKSKAENSILKVEKLESQNKLIYLAILVVGLVSTIIIGIVYFKKRRKRLQQEKDLEVKKTELKYSKKVHDVVSNGIYQVITKLENGLDISRNETLDDLEYLYDRSRNISYEDFEHPESNEFFSEKIRKLIGYFNTHNVQTIIAGNDASIWEGVSPFKRGEVYLILRELLVNMKKHSHADRVTLKFERIENRITVTYSDTGIGLKEETIFKNGIRNVESRIVNLEGVINFDEETEKGLKIDFSFSAI